MPTARGHIVVRRKAKDGNDGKGILYVTISYATSSSATQTPTDGWQSVIPEVLDNYYLWTRTVTTYTDGTVTTSYSVSRQGKGIRSVVIMYASSSQGVNPPEDGWQFNIPQVAAGSYLWTRTVTTYTDDTTTTSYAVGMNGTNGTNGAKGDKGDKGDTGATGAKGDKGDTGSSGVGIRSITNYYLASANGSGITPSSAGWTTAVQAVTSTKKYLWNYEKVTYTDNTVTQTDARIIGVYGDTGSAGATGVGISSIVEYYLASASSSGVTTSTAGWTTSVQTVTATKKYLWNYEVITYTNNTTKTIAPHITGVYGDKGDTGATGATGAKGDKGDKGDTGATGATGPRGFSGCIYRITLWEKGKQYRNDTYLETDDVKYIDVCVDTPIAIIGQTTVNAYVCKVTHTASNSIPLGNSTYWTAMESFAPIITPLLLTQAISADYIACGEIAANSAFIETLVAQQAFIDALVVKTLDTAPSASGDKVRIDGDGFSLYDSNGRRKCRVDNKTVGLYDDLVFTRNPNYLSSGLSKDRQIGVYVYTAQQNRYFPDELFSFINLGYCDKQSVIRLDSIKLTINPTSQNTNITMYMYPPQFEVGLWKDGVCVLSSCPTMSPQSCSMGGTITFTLTPNFNYTVTDDGTYTIRVRIYRNSGPVTATSNCYMYSSSGSGVVTVNVNSLFKFSLSRSNYEYTHIGNDGMMQVMGSGFFFSSADEFVIRRNNYMLKISSSGIQKSINGGTSWTSL